MLSQLFNHFKESSDSASSPFLIVGLGNPGRNYRLTRHNIGFMVVDRIAGQLKCPLTKVQGKALVSTSRIGEQKIILAKPQAFMNLSGIAVSSLVRFYKIDLEHLLVIHDDVDVPFGQIRLRPGGGSAGQKGVESIIERLATKAFPRLRMGIGQPPGRMDSADYVLLPFGKDEGEELDNFLDRAAEAVRSFVNEGLDTAMNRFNPKI
jgi:PTH1 family peptidyl-tRNA hydrolase